MTCDHCGAVFGSLRALANHRRWLPSFADRFWAKVDMSGGLFECWLWTGSRRHGGYGNVRRNGRVLTATRVAWELAKGSPVPRDLFVCHTCDNPPCVNPAHLWLGTNAENVIDMYAKQRWARRPGSHHARAPQIRHKLTPDQVREIRGLLGDGVPWSAIAARYGVAKSTVQRIVNGGSWAWVA